jgi:hypothetical protein
MRLTLVACSILLALSAAAASAAEPSPSAQADQLIAEGYKLRVQGKKAEALDLFLRAHALAPSAKTLGQIGSAEAALGRWVDADDHLEEALSRHDSPWIELPENRRIIEQTLADVRQHVGILRFGGPAGAEVFVNGRSVGALPLARPVRVTPGTAAISVTAKGFQPFREELAVQGGSDQTVSVPLVPEPASPPAVTLVQPVSSPTRATRRHLWLGGGLALVGLAGVGLGIGWLAVDGRPTCNAPAGGLCEHLYDTKGEGWVALGVGAAALAVGTTILLWPSEHAPTVTISSRSITFTGLF